MFLDRHGFSLGLAGRCRRRPAIRLAVDRRRPRTPAARHRRASRRRQRQARSSSPARSGITPSSTTRAVFYWLLVGSSLLAVPARADERRVRQRPGDAARVVRAGGPPGERRSSPRRRPSSPASSDGRWRARPRAFSPRCSSPSRRLSVQTTTCCATTRAQVLLVCAAVHARSPRRRATAALWRCSRASSRGWRRPSSTPACSRCRPRDCLARSARRPGRREDGTRRHGCCRVLGAVIVTNHFLWWDFPNFVEQLSDQVGITGPGHWGAVQNPAAFHTGSSRIRRRWVCSCLRRLRRPRACHGPPSRVGVLDVSAPLQLVHHQASVAVSSMGASRCCPSWPSPALAPWRGSCRP